MSGGFVRSQGNEEQSHEEHSRLEQAVEQPIPEELLGHISDIIEANDEEEWQCECERGEDQVRDLFNEIDIKR